MAERVFNVPQYRALDPASRLVLLTLREVLPRRGWGVIVGRNGALSELTGMPMGRVARALDDLSRYGLIRIDGNTIYLSPCVARRRPAPPAPSADPESQDPVKAVETQQAKPKARSTKKTPKRWEYTPEFEAAWALYPKRVGGNPKLPAFRAWCARLAEGVTAEQLTDATRRYRDYIEAMVAERGAEARRYVMQAQTFYGPNGRWSDEYEFTDDSPDLYTLYGD